MNPPVDPLVERLEQFPVRLVRYEGASLSAKVGPGHKDNRDPIADYFEDDEEGFPRRLGLQKAKVVRETIRAIEASNEYPELIRIE